MKMITPKTCYIHIILSSIALALNTFVVVSSIFSIIIIGVNFSNIFFGLMGISLSLMMIMDITRYVTILKEISKLS